LLEELVIEHGSPTLAGLKTGNLFRVCGGDEAEIKQEVRELNRVLKGKGLRVMLLKKNGAGDLIYIYRPDFLKRDLTDPLAAHILTCKGYPCDKAEFCITFLANRLKNSDSFPHEIGLFLGYPPSDVECFMNNPTCGVKCVGCWKVYSDEEGAKRAFRKYRKCTEVYRELSKKGSPIEMLAVRTGSKMVG